MRGEHWMRWCFERKLESKNTLYNFIDYFIDLGDEPRLKSRGSGEWVGFTFTHSCQKLICICAAQFNEKRGLGPKSCFQSYVESESEKRCLGGI